MILFPPPLPSFPSSREKGVGGLLEKTPGESFPAIKPVPSPPPGQLGSIWPGTLEAPSPAWRRCHSANNGGKERKAMRLPMLQMTSSMGDWLVLRESLLGGPGAYSLCFHSPHPLVQERTFLGGRDRPSGCEFRWKLGRELYPRKPLSLSGSDWSGNSNYPNHSSAPRGKSQEKKCEQAVKLGIHVFLRGEFLFTVLRTGPVSVLLGFHPIADKQEIGRNRRSL